MRKYLFHGLVASCLAVACSVRSVPVDVCPAPAAVALSAGAEQLLRPSEVRTRKLHVVRPDLLHYPLAYDTYC